MTSFAEDIRPLFREKDVESMSGSFDLSNLADVRDNSEAIYAHVENGSMPCDTTWTAEQVILFRQWIDDGFPE